LQNARLSKSRQTAFPEKKTKRPPTGPEIQLAVINAAEEDQNGWPRLLALWLAKYLLWALVLRGLKLWLGV
jgi:hypothetical protein